MTSFTCEALGRLFPAPIFPGPLALRVPSADQQLWAPRTRATPSPPAPRRRTLRATRPSGGCAHSGVSAELLRGPMVTEGDAVAVTTRGQPPERLCPSPLRCPQDECAKRAG